MALPSWGSGPGTALQLLARGNEPVVIRRDLPGDSRDTQARYLEAAIEGVIVASLYLPNGNPFPGPKFDYKLAWFERLLGHAADLLHTGHPVILAGDYNVVPSDADIYSPTTWRDNALLQPEVREAYRRLLKQGWTDALRTPATRRTEFTFWDYRRNRWQRNAGLRIDHVLLSRSLKPMLVDAGVDKEVRDVEKASDHAPVGVKLKISRSKTTNSRRLLGQ